MTAFVTRFENGKTVVLVKDDHARWLAESILVALMRINETLRSTYAG